MFRKLIDKITDYIIEKRVLRDLREQKEEYAREIMEEYLEENKNCIGVYDKKGHLKEIRRFKVI